ncbi:MAG: hypothetical protein Q8L66_00810 [Caulobacter sp.]|nr:hypothetical protein [Caulobacter sp.]
MILSRHLTALAVIMTACLALPGAALARRALPEAAAPAQQPALPVPPPTEPQAVARAQAEADNAIANAEIGDLFENITDGEFPSVRHRLSGMVCDWDPGTDILLHAFEGMPRGEDVSCGNTTLGVTFTLYATRYPERPTAKEIVDGSIPAIRQVFTDVQAYDGAAVSMNREGDDQPKIATARMTARIGGRKVFTRSSAVVVGEWVIAQRVTAPVSDAATADLMAELGLITVIDKMVSGRQTAK